LYGFALTPAPAKILGKLTELAPNIREVYAVYNPARSQWLVDDINKAGASLNLRITLTSADNLPQAAKLINQHLDTAIPNQSAIWLLESRFSSDNSLMSQILEQAWEKNLAVFSANPSHIRRGLLFSMYPDNVKLGQALGQLAQKLQQQGLDNKEAGHDKTTRPAPIQVSPLEHLHTGINIRTAEHLGLKIPRNQTFDLVYPAK
jgi:putative ABC transport system substrate-binding protein